MRFKASFHVFSNLYNFTKKLNNINLIAYLLTYFRKVNYYKLLLIYISCY